MVAALDSFLRGDVVDVYVMVDDLPFPSLFFTTTTWWDGVQTGYKVCDGGGVLTKPGCVAMYDIVLVWFTLICEHIFIHFPFPLSMFGAVSSGEHVILLYVVS